MDARPDQRDPLADEVSRPHWDAAAEGKLLIQRCSSCGRHQWYPRAHCRHCFAGDPEWVEAGGRGTLHSFTVVLRTGDPAFATPYVHALVDLDEGVRVSANILDVPHDELAVGMGLMVRFAPNASGFVLPQFTAEPARP